MKMINRLLVDRLHDGDTILYWYFSRILILLLILFVHRLLENSLENN